MSVKECHECKYCDTPINKGPCDRCAVDPSHPVWEAKSCDNCKNKATLRYEMPCCECILRGGFANWEKKPIEVGPIFPLSWKAPIIVDERTSMLAETIRQQFEKTIQERDRSIMRSVTMISLRPKKIITNGPATIVFWSDDTKTIVKCAEGEHQDVYIAFTAALAKKVFGSNSRLKKSIKKCLVEQK